MAVTDWHDFMPHEIVYKPLISHDKNGKPMWASSGTTYRARVSTSFKKVPNMRAAGQDVVASPVIWVGAVLPNLQIDDRIELPDGSVPIIVNFSTIPDEGGDHHTKIFCSGVWET